MEKWDTCPMEEPSSRLQSWVHCCTHNHLDLLKLGESTPGAVA